MGGGRGGGELATGSHPPPPPPPPGSAYLHYKYLEEVASGVVVLYLSCNKGSNIAAHCHLGNVRYMLSNTGV